MIRSICEATFGEHYTLLSFFCHCGYLFLLRWLVDGCWFINQRFLREERALFKNRFATLLLLLRRLIRPAQTQLFRDLLADNQLLPTTIYIVGTSPIRVLVLRLFAFCVLLDTVHLNGLTIANDYSVDTVAAHALEFWSSGSWTRLHLLLHCFKRWSL